MTIEDIQLDAIQKMQLASLAAITHKPWTQVLSEALEQYRVKESVGDEKAHPKKLRQTSRGALAHLQVYLQVYLSEADIKKVRQEMWDGFPYRNRY